MANATKLTIGGQQFDVKDAQARADVTELKSATNTRLNAIAGDEVLTLSWEQGGLDVQGQEVQSASRIRTDFINVSDKNYLVYRIAANYRMCVFLYNASQGFIRYAGWYSGDATGTLDISAVAYVRLLFSRLNDSLTPYATVSDANANLAAYAEEIALPYIKSGLRAQLAPSNDLNELVDTGVYGFGWSASLTNAPDGIGNGFRYVSVYKPNSGVSYQEIINNTTGNGWVRTRHDNTVWESWVQLDAALHTKVDSSFLSRTYTSGATLDDMIEPGYYVIPYADNIGSYDPFGPNTRRVVEVYKHASSDYKVQKIWRYDALDMGAYVRFYGGSPAVWSAFMPETADSAKNINLYSHFTPSNSMRYVYAKGKMWNALWNTEEAYKLAAEDPKCWGISGDVQFTSDGKLIMYHDSNVTYNGSSVAISSLTYEQVQGIVLQASGVDYSVPDYETFLDICRNSGKFCFVETKGPSAAYAWTGNNHTTDFEKLVKAVLDRGMQDSVLFLVPASDITYLEAHYPKLGIMRVADASVTDAEIAASIKNPQRIIGAYPTAWTAEKIATLHDAGRLMMSYTTRPQTIEQIQSMIDLGVDAVLVFIEPPDVPVISDTKVVSYTRNSITAGNVSNSGTDLTVMSYNVANYNNDTSIYINDSQIINLKKMLSHYRPDVIGLQEAREYIDSNNTQSAHTYIYTPMYPYTHGLGGVTLLTKRPAYARVLVLHSLRLLRYALIDINSKKLLVISVHAVAGYDGHLPQSAESIAERYSEYDDLLKWAHGEITLPEYSTANAITCPTWDWCIITGDFNSITDTDWTNLTTLVSARNFTMANGGWLGRIKTHKSGMALDNILCSPDIIINSVEVPETLGSGLYSDHYPIVSNVTLL